MKDMKLVDQIAGYKIAGHKKMQNMKMQDMIWPANFVSCISVLCIFSAPETDTKDVVQSCTGLSLMYKAIVGSI